MRKARAIVHGSLTADDARRALLACLAMGLDAEARQTPAAPLVAFDADAGTELASGPDAIRSDASETTAVFREVWQLSVAADEVDSALPLIEEALAPENREPVVAPRTTLLEQPPGGIWTLAHSWLSLALAAVLIVVHLRVHDGEDEIARSAMIAAGAVAPWLVSQQHEWWRLLSAAFLHFDLKHLVGNLSALLFLGPPLAVALGQLRLALVFVVTAIAGNLASQLLGSEVAVKAGASGGICGLLGALAGVAIAAMARAGDARERRPAWQTLGALVALFGMIVGFEPGRDHYAHVGGLLSGLLAGWVLAPKPKPRGAGS